MTNAFDVGITMRAKIDLAAADFFPIERIFLNEASFGGKKRRSSESDATMYRINATRGAVLHSALVLHHNKSEATIFDSFVIG